MTIADRRDIPTLQQRHSEAGARILPMARILSGAAPVMDKLQRSEEWGRFASCLQGMVERYTAARNHAKDKLASPEVVEHTAMLKLKQDIVEAEATVKAFMFAIELPAAILQGKEEADKVIAQFEKRSVDAQQQNKD